MNGMLLAAGRGERMEPLSSLFAKPALEVLGRPLLSSAWDHLCSAGCHPIVVNLHRHQEQVRAAAEHCAEGDPRLTFSPEPALLGGAGGIAAARPLFAPGPVLAANGDVWARLDLAPLRALAAPETLVLGLIPHPDPTRWSSIRLGDDGVVEEIVPPAAFARPETLLFTGYQLLGEEVVAALPAPPAEMAPVWERLRRHGRLCGAVLTGSWREAGTPGGYRRLVTELAGEPGWVHPQARVESGATLVSSAVGRGCRVGRGVALRESVLIAGACVAGRGELGRCIVAGAAVATAPLHDCLVLPGGTFPL